MIIESEQDLRDAATYGVCWCGRPRRAHLEREGDTSTAWMGCDITGHNIEWSTDG